ncbi:MAG: MraY family glycosyltransferase [Verrucomicrobiia bacterium]
MRWLLVYLYAFDVSFVLALALTPVFRRLSHQWNFLDQPNLERKIHEQAMPLLGGMAVFCAFAGNVLFNYVAVLPLARMIDLTRLGLPDLRLYVPGAFSISYKLLVLLAGGAGMVALGLYDDRHDLKARPKLLWQLVIASVVALAGMRVTLFVSNPLVSFVLTVLWIVTITNALNFLDNMDGLCAGVGAICALLFGLVSAVQGQFFVCVLAVGLAGALVGFLPYNFKPASIFLGDAGSHFIGYMLAVLPVLTTFYHTAGPRHAETPTHLPVLIPLLVLAVPLFDLVMVMWIRLQHRQPVHIGDANHLSHRLVRLGLPQSRAVTLIYLITLTLGLGATVLLWSDLTAALIVLAQAIGILAIVTLLERLGGK